MLNLASANLSSSFNKIILSRQSKISSSKIKFNKIKKVNKLNFSSSLEKSEISQLKLIGQFDKKFLILCVKNKIVILDQHAIHERILYEFYSLLLKKEFLNLETDADETEKNLSKYNTFHAVFSKHYLDKPLRIKITQSVLPKIKLDPDKTSNLFHFEFCIKKDAVYLYSVPIIFDKVLEEKEYIKTFESILSHLDILVEVREGRSKINKSYLYLVFDSFLYHIKSKACRDAVKFNEKLEEEFISSLLRNLSTCNNPFLCAHGRHSFFIIAEKF
jgi:DNA mismatch repair ATPase MutL